MKPSIHVLYLEDDANDVALAEAALEAEGLSCEMTVAQDRAEFSRLIHARDYDVILSDFTLPAFDGLTALTMAQVQCPDVPFLLVSGTLGEEQAIDSLKRGATDYVLKHRLFRLGPALRRAMVEVQERQRRRQAEEKREEYSRKLEVLTRQLVEAQESERRSIARELHDEIGQSLTAMQLNLQAMIQISDPNPLKGRLEDTLAIAGRVLEQVQDMSLNLRPSMLDDLGLEAALRWYVKRQADVGKITSKLVMSPMLGRLDSIVETGCFRVAQEALTNVLRHAGASGVIVELRVDGERLHLHVRDDGSGFDVEATKETAIRGKSLGLLSMEERAELAGGGLEISSAAGEGTEVHAWFPMRRRERSGL